MMNNIPQDKLQQLHQNGEEAVSAYNEFVKWTDSYKEGEERYTVNYLIKKYRRYSNNIISIIEKKPVIALFGKSQVGKSYLVDNILATETEKKLKIPNFTDGSEHYFLGELNPEGGKESTGVVSRFSIEKNDLQKQYPIEVKLITPKDLIIIMCDGYYSDIKDYVNPRGISKDEIIDFLSEITSICGSTAQHYLSDDDLYEIQDYLGKYFKDKTQLMNFKDAGFWNILADSIMKIPPKNWVKVFELLWGRVERFNKLFISLINELEHLNFSKIVFVEFSALLQKYGSILDVTRIFELESDSRPKVNVEIDNKQTKLITRSKLAALTYEVIIPIKEELSDKNKGGKEFLKKVDILDFPGARSREQDDESKIPTMSNNEFYNYFRRGKVAYLFNRYSELFEINSLLFCVDNEQLEVKELSFLLKNWIDFYIGADVAERTEKLNEIINKNTSNINNIDPLFIIFTKANLMLEYKDTDVSGNYDYKWRTRFEDIFIKEFCKGNNWYKEWKYKNDNKQSIEEFKNMYMLRSFKWDAGIYEGYAEHNKESNIKAIREDYMKGLSESFLNLNFCQKHFHNPEKSWKEFTDLNKDGSEYIIENITPIANNNYRTRLFVKKLKEYRDAIIDEIKTKHYHSDKLDEQINKAEKESKEVIDDMNYYFDRYEDSRYEFGNFIEHFNISEANIRDFFRNIMRMDKEETEEDKKKLNYELFRGSIGIEIKSYKDDEEKDKLYKESMALCMKYHKMTKDEVVEYYTKKYPNFNFDDLFFGGKSNYKKYSDILAEKVKDFWFETKLNIENFKHFTDMGFNTTNLEKLLQNFKTTFETLNISQKIAFRIRDYVNDYVRNEEMDDMVAHIAASTINEFVNNVGWTNYKPEQKKKIIDSNKANDLNLKIPNDEKVFKSLTKTTVEGSDKMSVEKLLDLIEEDAETNKEAQKYVPFRVNYFKWTELLKISFISNCNIPTYNRIANKELKKIFDKIKKIEYKID